MTISSFSNSFTINQVPFSVYTDTYINIQKRRENVIYRSSSSANNVNLAYIQSETINSSTNLTIQDRSTSLLENRVYTQLKDQILQDITGFQIELDLFLVTNQFTTELNTQQQIPLFYRHQVLAQLGIDETYGDIRLLDGNFNNLLSSNYLVNQTTGAVYTNLFNQYSPITGLSIVYYVTYIVRKPNNTIDRYTEILNSQPVFHEATLEDIDPGTGFLYPDATAYILQEGLGNTFDVLLPVTNTYGLRRAPTSRIQILNPPPTGPENPWFVQVRNGKFLSTVSTGINKYYLADWAAQVFSPFPPYKQVDETSYRVNPRLIKTIKNNIAYLPEEALFPEVIISDSTGTFKFAFTSDPTKLGTEVLGIGFYSNVLLGNSKVSGTTVNAVTTGIAGSSIDNSRGFIVIPAGYQIAETDIVRTIYTYIEQEFEFTEFDFNLLTSADLLNQRVSLIIRPEPLGETYTKTLYWLLVNEDGLVTDTNIDFTLSGISSLEDTIISSGLWYNRNPDTVFWSEPGSIDFVDYYTVEGNNNSADLLILGDIYSREYIKPNSLVINDIRVRGGGIRQENLTTAVSNNTEVEWYWDNSTWDGKAFPGAAAIVVEVPIDILTECSGIFTGEYIQGVANRHIAQGVYPVVMSYNTSEPTVTGLDYLTSGIRISWSECPPDTLFSVYLSNSSVGPWSGVATEITDNSYTIPTQSGVDKYLLVTGHLPDEPTCFDGPIGLNNEKPIQLT